MAASASCVDSRGIRRGSCNICMCYCYSWDEDGSSLKCTVCEHAPGQHVLIKDDHEPLTLDLEPPASQLGYSGPKIKSDESVPRSESFMERNLLQRTLGDYERQTPPSRVRRQTFQAQRTWKEDGLPGGMYSEAVAEQDQCSLPGCCSARWVDQHGVPSPCCSRSHLRLLHQSTTTDVVSLELKCKGCSRQRYPRDDGTYFDFCGMSCRDAYHSHGGRLSSVSTPNLSNPAKLPDRCALPSCNKRRHFDATTNTVYDFCGKNHATRAAEQGMQVMNIKSVSREVFEEVSCEFQMKWDSKKGDCPRVEYVLHITNFHVKKRWDDYRGNLQRNCVERYYHGTKLACDITRTRRLCADNMCGICGISRTGFQAARIGTNIRFKRFGHGFYLAPNSSKCHDYTQSVGGYHRAMLQCEVCPGNKYVCTQRNTGLKTPPQGFDSVYGNTGGELNYAEITVFKSEAILPKYIILYKKDGTNKIA